MIFGAGQKWGKSKARAGGLLRLVLGVVEGRGRVARGPGRVPRLGPAELQHGPALRVVHGHDADGAVDPVVLRAGKLLVPLFSFSW